MNTEPPEYTSGQKQSEASDGTGAAPQLEPPEKHQDERHYSSPDPTPLWRIALDVGAIAIGLIVAYIYGSQLNVMQGQLLEMKGSGKQTDQLICLYREQVGKLSEQIKKLDASIDATNRLADEQKRAADAASASLAYAREQLRIGNRPWVGIDDTPEAMQTTPLRFDDKGNANISTQAILRNFGPSAAQNVSSMGFLVISEDIKYVKQQQDVACGRYVSSSHATDVLFPNSRDRYRVGPPGFVPRDQIQVGKTGKALAWWVGCVGYRDQFNTFVYRTRFIYMLRTDQDRPKEFTPLPNTTVEGTFKVRETSIDEQPVKR